MELPSTKPYLLRAIWEWCCDNGFTPYIAVEVDERTRVPREFVRDGQIVLNLGPDATKKLLIGNDFIDFQARFGGVARDLSVPVERVSAIYARENGAGMAFEVDGAEDEGTAEFVDAGEVAVEPEEPPPEPPRPDAGRPWLQRIK
ncbi:MAG: ClpXP protease specificity-enhancing factor [Gammaproteobacteria bacterium]|nr:ClpXP protease specificity-enhancing factor [Gammaproteobacteria bacterium]MBU1603516.1 ClpXP protease specificity-enhancing factor [Gammaproteobacteria bacterium]MBU2433036.1 ClpXP protease specificity-enhancing factor [Gammaproteobacteria bacterium]MBU2450279.1 ClpXP protease specificity-enhancing factor [Gammaproteobacteria bacterium]